MKKWTSLGESVLFAGNLFLLFLLIFGDKIVEPVWMQVLGRMHPLLLHFPIVLLLMAVLWEWLPLRREAAFRDQYRRVDRALWITGALSAMLTAIMGMLLSLQGGYEGPAVQWHKWAGVAIAYLSYAYYVYKHSARPQPLAGKIAGGLVAACLLLAGHLGANITHGENFLLQPLEAGKKAPVPIDRAVVFEDLIKPVLEAKCLSCHNHRKAKGDLVMETAALLMKGGKDGKLFEPGQPELSLLIKRIHLPEADDDHMPPEGKPQLSPQEMRLLYWWIKSGAPVDQKVMALPEKDSLRILAAKILPAPGTTPAQEEKFTFAAADERKIEKLSNNYRVITPLAQQSPALVVNFFNKNHFSSAALKELSELSEQVVEINLAKMPVKDEDLSILAQFPNLRTLNLNFTDISGKNMKALSGLKHLKHLAVSGTQLNAAALEAICRLPALQDLYCWSIAAGTGDIARLEKTYKKIRFDAGYQDTSGAILPLPPPLLKTPSGIFSDSLLVQLRHPIQGVEIRYTLDGTEPDSLHGTLYQGPIALRENTRLKARAYKKGWSGSQAVEAGYYRSAYRPDSIVLLTQPDEKYRGQGGRTLMDRDLGDTNYGNGQWLGYRGEDMQLMMAFHSPVTLHTLSLNYLRQVPGYIFPPARLEVWGGDDPDHLQLMGRSALGLPDKDAPAATLLLDCPLKGVAVRYMKVVAKPLARLPAWHPGKGQPAWLMASEILLN